MANTRMQTMSKHTLTQNQEEVFSLFKLILGRPKAYNKCQKMANSALTNSLFAAGRMPVRFISEKAMAERAKDTKYRPCYEHYFSRTKSVQDILRAFERGKSDNFIKRLLMSRMRGHYTTSEENITLKKYDTLFWRDAYKAAGIKLVPWVATPARKFDYIIEGVTYTSPSKVAKKYKMSKEGVSYRCKAKTFPKWRLKKVA